MKKDNRLFARNAAAPLLLLSMVALLLTACGPRYLFEEAKEIPGGQWAYADTVQFKFTVSDTSEVYGLYLDFEYADTFATQNLYVKLHTVFPDGKRLSKQQSFEFFDDQGKPLGEHSGGKSRLRIVLQERTFFNQPGEYIIALEQFTRTNPLPGMYSIGLAILGTQR